MGREGRYLFHFSIQAESEIEQPSRVITVWQIVHAMSVSSEISQFLLGIFVIFESTYQFVKTMLRDCNHCLQSL